MPRWGASPICIFFYLGSLPCSVPVFEAGPSRPAGLDLLAAAALTGGDGTPLISSSGAKDTGVGPVSAFNPAAAVSMRVVKRILDLEFVEMADITADDDGSLSAARPGGASRPPVTGISQWVEKFSVMAAILTTRFPEKAPELFAYQASIVRAERNYEGKQWVVYDRQFRREALARKDLNWSVPNPRLYNEAFTGRAKAIPRCAYCLQDDHMAAACPRNPARTGAWGPPFWPGQPHGGTPVTPSQEICRNFNSGKCRKSNCWYTHACLVCQEPHAAVACPRRRQSSGKGFRSRSPHAPFGRR